MDQVPRVTIAQAYDVLSSLGFFKSDTFDFKLQKVFLICRITQFKSDKFGRKTRCNRSSGRIFTDAGWWNNGWRKT